MIYCRSCCHECYIHSKVLNFKVLFTNFSELICMRYCCDACTFNYLHFQVTLLIDSRSIFNALKGILYFDLCQISVCSKSQSIEYFALEVQMELESYFYVLKDSNFLLWLLRAKISTRQKIDKMIFSDINNKFVFVTCVKLA